MRTKEDLFALNLPKWPQMIVTGSAIPVYDALEIIRRTDRFFDFCHGGNNRCFNTKARAAVFFPENNCEFQEYWQKIQFWRKSWGYIDCSYVLNDWISSAFVKGPHGWCHPDGTIGFIDNVGKWPDIKDVYDDWVTIAAAFPFLELEITLMSGEGCEEGIEPVVSFIVRNGKAETVDPRERDVHKEYNRSILREPDDEEFCRILSMRLRDHSLENALPLEQIQLWGQQLIEKLGLISEETVGGMRDRVTEIQALLKSDFFNGDKEECKLMEEQRELEFLIELAENASSKKF